MKKVKTINGIKKIDDRNAELVLLQLREILQQHRATLIEKLLGSELAYYIDYKFNEKPALTEITTIKDRLIELKDSPIDLVLYSSIFEDVLSKEVTALNNYLFYQEIDRAISACLSSSATLKISYSNLN